MHISVLLNESIEKLNLKENSIIVDATLGRGGHSKEILKKIHDGFLYAFDQDDEAIKKSLENLSEFSNFELINSNFANMKEKLAEKNVDKVDGVLYDLGVSSPQLDDGDRGFSFHQDARLDMRMDQASELSAYEVVNNLSYIELVTILRKYGEEKFTNSIVKNIIREREKQPITTTLELVEIIKKSVPEKYKKEGHPARKTFQAIRIYVNNELENFEKSLKDSLEILKVGGRICVITFHSLEDKICKDVFNEVSKIDDFIKRQPIIPEEFLPNYKVISSVKPSKEEVEFNKRARSAKLRIIERVK